MTDISQPKKLLEYLRTTLFELHLLEDTIVMTCYGQPTKSSFSCSPSGAIPSGAIYLYGVFSFNCTENSFKFLIRQLLIPDPCSSDPCRNGGTCTVASVSYTCSCRSGFTGMLCETNTQGTSSVIAGLPPARSGLGTEPHTHRIWPTSFRLVVTLLTEHTYVRV